MLKAHGKPTRESPFQTCSRGVADIAQRLQADGQRIAQSIGFNQFSMPLPITSSM